MPFNARQDVALVTCGLRASDARAVFWQDDGMFVRVPLLISLHEQVHAVRSLQKRELHPVIN